MSMRRKSERNKGKGSPEKKVEKPTRKSTRRRARKSPSTSPDRESACDTVSSTPSVNESDKESVNARLNELEVIQEDSETKKITSTEPDTATLSPEDDNNGSVWKVARADASPGEIQKLKLCRQRNISEASSDNSTSRKRSNKWQGSGEGIGEEDDSTDEQLTPSKRVSGCENPDDPSSSHPGQDSNEEVSDYKETLPETTSANLSDDKPNIDRQGDAHEISHSDLTVETECKPNETTEPAVEPALDTEYPKETTPTDVTEEAEEDVTSAAAPVEETKEKVEIDKETSVEEPEKITHKGFSSSEDEHENEKSQHSDSSTNDEASDNKVGRSRVSSKVSRSRVGRRKHRDKYHDSSNSDTMESEDEPCDERKIKNDEEDQPEDKPIAEELDIKKEHSKSPEESSRSILPSVPEESEKQPEDNKESLSAQSNNVDNTMPVNNAPTCIQKPMKVNLKRSFVRTVVETNTSKESSEGKTDGEIMDQNKENCAIEPKCVPKRRRWGTSLSSDITPAFSVSTDSLKALVPGAKPLSLNEVRLSKDDDDSESRKARDRKHSSNNANIDQKTREDMGKKGDTVMDNHIGKRKISIVTDLTIDSPSPPAVKPTNILLIKNLVRPFTLNQIKELLSRTGTIVENGFWMDRIKSKCYVEYSNEDQAFETKQALHGVSWPLSNPKKLQVEYASKEDMQFARESSKDQPVQRKSEPVVSSESWQQGWTQEERNNTTTKIMVVREWDLGKEDGLQVHLKEKEREKKEQDKKRRQRSRSPNVEIHLPAPARKFKKKEDEPPPAKLLDDLFRKTKATPCIYWLPLTNEQIVVKKEMRRQHMAEHARRLEEMRRAERNRERERDRDRRRRSPRK